MKRICFTIQLLSFLVFSFCTNNGILGQCTLNINVWSSDHQALPGAQVVVKHSDLVSKVLLTDSFGRSRFLLPRGKYTVSVRFLGFGEFRDSFLLEKNRELKVLLEPVSVESRDVIIRGERQDRNVVSANVGLTTLQRREINALPKMIGESDAIKALQYTPGVTLSDEGNSGLYVRGGANDQNLILLDGSVVFNPSHMLGIFSVFNTDVIQDVKLYKSAIPSDFGGRLSSVLDIETIKGNDQKTEGQGSIGLISSKMTISGPLKNGKASFYLSARKCYFSALLNPLSRLIIKSSHLAFDGLWYGFYDANAGVSVKFSEKDVFRINFYTGNDRFELNNDEITLTNTILWKNTAVSGQWKHSFSSSAFLTAIISGSWYDFNLSAVQNSSAFRMQSSIENTDGKFYLTRFSGIHTFKAGIQTSVLKTVPDSRNTSITQIDLQYDQMNQYRNYEYTAFVNDEADLGRKWKLNVGYRQSFYQLAGPYKNVNYDNAGDPVDSVVFKKGQTVKWYVYPEIRASLRYLFNPEWAAKASYTNMVQYINQVSTSTVSLPSDFWVPSTPKIKPQLCQQVAIGVYRNFRDNTFETSLEAFYKKMDNQIEFDNSIFNTKKIKNFENNFVQGRGKAFGIEIYIKKSKGKTTGWISYTLSRSLRYFDGINEGKVFPAKYDRIHDGSLVIIHTLNDRWSFSAVFVYATGEAFTVPVARYIVQGNVLNEYGAYNGYRLPDYHRLDVSATWKLKQDKRFRSEINFSVYNLYNRQNPVFIYNDMRGDLDKYELSVVPKQLSLLPVLPSVSWTFSF